MTTKPAKKEPPPTGTRRRYKKKPLVFEPSQAVPMTEEQEREAVELMVGLVDSYVVRHRHDPPRPAREADNEPGDEPTSPFEQSARLPLAERQDLLGRAVALWLARPDRADNYRKEAKAIDGLIRDRSRAIDRYERAFEDGTMPEELLADRVAELKQIREQLRGRKKEITAQLRARSGQRDANCLEGISLGVFLSEIFETLADRPAARALFRLFIERVDIGPERNVRPIYRLPVPSGFVWPQPPPPPKPPPRPGGDALGAALLERYGDDTWGRSKWVMHQQPADWRMIERSSEPTATIGLRDALDFANVHRWSILTTMRRDGRPQLSNVAHLLGADGRLRLSVTADRAKYHNLVRDPWAALHIASDDLCQYAVIEGEVELSAVAAAPNDATVDELVEFFSERIGEPVDEDVYRAACVTERRVVVRLAPIRAYGLLRPLPTDDW